LVTEAIKCCDTVIASIFINPTQFNDKKDLERYPRTEIEDIMLLSKAKCDAVFIPAIEEIYPNQVHSSVFDFGTLTQLWEGEFRPGHFNGVITVVGRLFELVQPHFAFFGKKDFQQFLVISHWTKINQLPIKIIGCETIRTGEGLAMSSRNARLSEQEKSAALAISKSLYFLRERKGIEALKETLDFVKTQFIEPAGVRLEYLCCANNATLEPYENWPNASCVLLVAGWIGEVRLIDELEVH
jgi:pantoate--beta-alanine ligase